MFDVGAGGRFVAWILAASLCFWAGPAAATPRVLEVDDLFAIGRVADPQISPDGRSVAYTVSRADLEKDESETALWLASVPAPSSDDPEDASGAVDKPRRLTAPGYSASRPRWSPDGAHLTFLASRKIGEEEAKTQVWSFDMRGGDAQPVTEVKQGVRSFEVSPDGKRLLLTIRDAKPEELLDEAERKKLKPEPHVIDRLQFKRDYEGYLDRRREHLYVFDLESSTLTQITSGDTDDSDATWSPDGKRVAFTSNRTEEPDGNSNTDLWIVSADNTDQGKTLKQVTTQAGSDSSPAWSPDGKWLAYLTVTQPELIWYATQQLALVAVDEGEPSLLTAKLDRNVSAPRFSHDGDSIFFLLEDSGARHLAQIPRTGGKVRRLVAGDRRVSQFSMSPNGGIALLVSEPHLPPEVFHFGEASLRQLTATNRQFLEQIRLGEVREVRFPSADGTEIEGFLTLPPDYDEHLRYPALLRPHGGPVSQYDFGFHFESQLFAAHGYVVIRPNPRGSSGYGQDFSAAIFADWGKKDTADVLAAVDHAIAEGIADPDRLGVGGWSYGGMLTNYVITNTDRFKAAISGASEVLYVANYGHDHYQMFWELELGLPWENRQAWERISPFNDVEKIDTPTLILCGALDWNVPVLNSEQLYQALRRLGKKTQLIVYPGEHHGIRKPTFQKDRLERTLAWYDELVKGEVSAKPSATAAISD